MTSFKDKDVAGRQLQIDDYVSLSVDGKMTLGKIVDYSEIFKRGFYVEYNNGHGNVYMFRRPEELCKVEKTDAVSFILGLE